MKQPLVPQEVIKLARANRKWAEQTAIEDNYPDDLCGLCSRASCRLFLSLIFSGYHPVLCTTREHVWVELNNIIIDVTATQFKKYQKMLVLITKAPKEEPPYLNPSCFYDLEDFITHQRAAGWPIEYITQDADYVSRIT